MEWLLVLFLIPAILSKPTIFDSIRNILIESDQHLMMALQQQRSLKDEYDFIIIGAGTAGCTLASRLSEVSDWNILLLEAGGFEQFFMDIPAFVGSLQKTERDWQYYTEPSEHYCKAYPNNQCFVPRGKIFGGSSILNYMISTRGNEKDYNNWEAEGNPGWSYEDVLPYFKKAENMTIPELRGSSHHGTNGPLKIAHTKYHTILGKAWVEAGRELGHRVGDYNGESQTSFSYFQFTQNEMGRRQSNPRAYIYPILKDRKNLDIRVNSSVWQLIIDENQAKGITIEEEGNVRRITARKEVILSAGSINTPKILMLSGIGPKDHLNKLGIPLKVDLPVGQNYQDHFSFGGLIFTTDIKSKDLISYEIANSSTNLMNYIENGDGPFTIPGGNEGLFFYDPSSPNDFKGYPEIELHFSSVSPIPEEAVRGYRENVFNEIFKPIFGKVTWAVQPIIMHPKSRGKVELRSSDPKEAPKITPNFFENPDDVALILKGIKKAVQISQTRAFRQFNSQPLRTKIPGCNNKWGTDEYWKCAMRVTTITNYHQCGTCRMGPGGVVDETLRVRGVQSLRIVDASIMPLVPAAHTNIPTNMIAEKAADIIKKEYGKLN